MLGSEARKAAGTIEERAGKRNDDTPVVTARVVAFDWRQGKTTFGAGSATFVRYDVEVSDGTCKAHLDLDTAERLAGGMEPGTDAESIFETIRSLGGSVEAIDESS